VVEQIVTELQLLNYVIANKSLDLLVHNNITPDKFSEAYMMEAMFIFNHHSEYGKVPDYPTMLNEFEDFEVIEVLETEKYLVSKFVESLKQRLQIEAINEWAKKLGGKDSDEAFVSIRRRVEDIENIDVGASVAVDIVKDTSRHQRYVEALENPDVSGIPTNIKLLDDIIHGILDNDLTVIAARTNQGKSFWGLKLAANMWDFGKRILFYSGENSVLNTGYRFDTLTEHFSNSGLMFGDKNLKNGKTPKMYENYIKSLAEKTIPFYVVTPQEINGERLTITKLKSLVRQYEPEVIFLDQLSLMSDERAKRNQGERFRYSNIMEDLRLFVESHHIPVIIMSQTSRNNAKNDDGLLEPARIEHLSESDGVGQNATKVITFAVNKGVMHVMVRKNTNGEKERGFKMIWDIDTGTFEQFSDPEDFEQVPPDEDEEDNREAVF
jgi:replicative DNA helicase